MNENKISIIVPVYNVEKYLEQCLDSLINQTYQNIEIILVDDGSTDFSVQICGKYEKYDDRIRIIHKENGGLSDARNVGLTLATGEFVGFVDSDDFIDKDMFFKMIEALLEYEADIAICRFRMFDDDNKFLTDDGQGNIIVMNSEEALNYYVVEDSDYLITPAVWVKLFKREVIENIMFPAGKLCEDILFTTKALYKARKIVYLDKSFYSYRVRDNSIMNNSLSYPRMVFDELTEYQRRIEFFATMNQAGLAELCKAKLYIRLLERYYELSIFNTNKAEIIKKKIYLEIKLLTDSMRQCIKNNLFNIHNPLMVYCSFISINGYVKLRKIKNKMRGNNG